MIQEKTHVQVVGQVHLEPESVLANDLRMSSGVDSFILSPFSLSGGLPASMLDMKPVSGQIKPGEDLGFDVSAMLELLFESVVTGPVQKPGHRITVSGEIVRTLIGVPVDHGRVLGYVPLVQPEAADALFATPS